MLSPLDIPAPFITSELDFHRQRIADEVATAELRRRHRVARRERRQELAAKRNQRRNAPRTA